MGWPLWSPLFFYAFFFKFIQNEIQQVFWAMSLPTFPVLNGSVWDSKVFAEDLLGHPCGFSQFFDVHLQSVLPDNFQHCFDVFVWPTILFESLSGKFTEVIRGKVTFQAFLLPSFCNGVSVVNIPSLNIRHIITISFKALSSTLWTFQPWRLRSVWWPVPICLWWFVVSLFHSPFR